MLSFRERVDAGLSMQPRHTSGRDINSKSPSVLNLDLHPLQKDDSVQAETTQYVRDLENKLLKMENKCAKLERETSQIGGSLSTHRRELETNFARDMKAQ